MNWILRAAFCMLLIQLVATSAFAQKVSFSWAKRFGSDYVMGLTAGVDNAGNVYTTGHFSVPVDFDPNSGTHTLDGYYGDCYLSKLNSAGNYVWAGQFQGVGTTCLPIASVVDGAGNSYLTGRFTGYADFDPDTGTFYMSGDADVFISKLDASGKLVWAKQFTELGIWSTSGNAIAIDTIGNVYVTGYFIDSIDVDPGPGVTKLVSSGDKDIFIVKLSPSGNLMWAKRVGDVWEDKGNAITVDRSGNVYVTGYFDGPIDFDPGPGVYSITGSVYFGADVFILKLNASGNFVWAKSFCGDFDEYGIGIKTDKLNNVYTTGYFQGAVDFDPHPVNTDSLTSAGASDVFVSKLDSNGKFIWAKRLGGDMQDEVSAIALDNKCNIYTAGYINSTADFDPGAGTYNLSAQYTTDNNGFISILDSAGNFKWAGVFFGISSDVRDIKLDTAGNIYCTGEYGGNTDFDPGTGVFNMAGIGTTTAFIVKLSWEPTTVPVNVIADRVRLYPNPCGNEVIVENAEDYSYTIFDLIGREQLKGAILSNSQQLNISELKSGVYLVSLKSKNGSVQTTKLLKN